MIDLDDVPAERALPAGRRDADRALLARVMVERRTIRSLPRRRPLIVAGGVVALLAVGGAAAAYTLLPPKAASVQDSGRCYGKLSTDFGDGFPGTTIGVASRPGQAAQDVPPQVLDACAAVWRAGFFTADGSQAPDPDPATTHAVPPLVACVLPSGQAAVFPGKADTCAVLGLAPMAPTP
jgi:hypothetical protein